jgi:type I restriction enzyme S subunit
MKKPIISAPMGWEAPMISDVLFFQEGPGVRKWQFREEGVKLLNVGNINNGELNLGSTKLHLEESEANGKYSHFLVDEGDLLIACSGIVVSNFHNKIAFAKKEHLPLCLNTSTMRFKPLDENVINLNFFRYFLQTEIFKKQLQRLITGSAQLNFGPSHIKKIALLLPPLPTQKKIAAILDEADSYRQKTKALLTKYDELTQSLFLDMFGDPVRNEKGWEKVGLEQISSISSGSTPSRKNEGNFKGNIPWVKTGEVNSRIIFDTEEKISEMALKNSSCKLYPAGSLIIAMYGQGKTRGQVGMLGIEASTNQACAVLTKSENANFTFLYKLIQMSYEDLRSLGRGGNQPNLNSGILKKYLVLSPPLTLQNQFAERVEAIEAQKAQAQKELEKAEELFGSLLQGAFKGEIR